MKRVKETFLGLRVSWAELAAVQEASRLLGVTPTRLLRMWVERVRSTVPRRCLSSAEQTFGSLSDDFQPALEVKPPAAIAGTGTSSPPAGGMSGPGPAWKPFHPARPGRLASRPHGDPVTKNGRPRARCAFTSERIRAFGVGIVQGHAEP